ncbi:hypothetical protein [Blastopirellula marina]|uniref:Leucine-rich repeat domain-containing protein n=1 Tax=Blastopirellula marina TaxID=124 RepID=A0A2S8GK23_9BACT|nr:hypothetical protein [Blastopirellula marina]PQO44785.1 hypothetical protein C5Y93_16945 [Blastopirellula marina]
MEEAVETVRKKKRSWRVRWSLRVLFVLIALMAGGLGWLSYYMRIGYLHDDVAANVAELGGRVTWELTRVIPPKVNALPNNNSQIFVGFTPPLKKVKGGPDWMQTWGVEPAYQRIEYVHFNQGSAEDLNRFLQQIERLDRVAGVHINTSPLTDEQLEHLFDHVEMEALGIGGTPIGERPLPFLSDTKLKYLFCDKTFVSDSFLDCLPVTLEHLMIPNTRVTDAGLEKLVRLKNLQLLVLRDTPTSEEAIEKLRDKMPWCEIEWSPQFRP